MADLPVLDATDQRILGSLLEKQITVPASYPLTLNSLRTACNQTSSREPVTDFDEPLIEQTARSLKDRGLLRIVWSDSGRRTLKYHQTLEELLGMDEAERALITVLLLRGAQSPGELKTRTERLHGFADREAVESTLRELAARPTPLVRQLERRAGQHDHRWIHLLGPTPGADETTGPTLPPPVAIDPSLRDSQVRATYDAVAEDYTAKLADELDDLPFERWLLDRVSADHAGRPVLDTGCGPGHIAGYLDAQGVEVHGIDISPAMIEIAERRHPDVTFRVGDLRQLMKPPAHDGWGAVLAWYSLVHTAPEEMPEILAAIARTLTPGGLVLIAVHALMPGAPATRHAEEWFGQDVDLTFTRQSPEQLASAAQAAGFVDVEWHLRNPVASRGETTHRLYLLARRPA